MHVVVRRSGVRAAESVPSALPSEASSTKERITSLDELLHSLIPESPTLKRLLVSPVVWTVPTPRKHALRMNRYKDTKPLRQREEV